MRAVCICVLHNKLSKWHKMAEVKYALFFFSKHGCHLVHWCRQQRRSISHSRVLPVAVGGTAGMLSVPHMKTCTLVCNERFITIYSWRRERCSYLEDISWSTPLSALAFSLHDLLIGLYSVWHRDPCQWIINNKYLKHGFHFLNVAHSTLCGYITDYVHTWNLCLHMCIIW